MDIQFKRTAAIFLCFALAITVSLITAGVAAARNGNELNIVAIDTNKVLEAHPAYIKAREKFATELQGLQKELKGMGKEEQAAAQQKMQQQLQEQGAKLQEEAITTMKNDIRKIAEQKGYDYVVDSNLLIVGGKNVTDEVLEALKAQNGGKE